MMFAIMSSVLFLFVGGSVDYARYNSLRSDLLQSLDAASLAIVRMEEMHENWTLDELVTYGEKFFIENSTSEGALLKSDHTAYTAINEVVKFDLVTDATQVKACVKGSIETHLLAVVNIKYLDIWQCSVITKAGAGRVELALVLDITGSMKTAPGGIGASGDTKLVSLQKAVTSMMDAMFGDDTQRDNLKIGVVPFNHFVNPGKASSWDPSWGDLNAEALYHGSRFIHVDEDGFVDPSTKVNHYQLYNSDPDSQWTGCVESRPFPLDELDTPPGASTSSTLISAAMTPPSPADEADPAIRTAFTQQPAFAPGVTLSDLSSATSSRFVPVFLGDDPNCSDTGDDRCAAESGVPYWESSGTFMRHGMPLPGRFHRNYYSRPELPGSSARRFLENQYRQRDYIDDELYIGRSSGDFGAAYGVVVEQFHQLRHISLTPPQVKFKDRMLNLGVRSNGFFDPDVTGPNDADPLDYDEFILRGAYVGWWDPSTQTYKSKYDLPKDDPSFHPGDPACAIPIVPMTDDRLLIDGGDANGDGFPDGGVVGSLYGGGDTNISNGVMWGWRVVSDGLPFTESTGPSDTGPNGTSEGDWRRAVVVMTDGENSVYDKDIHWNTAVSSYGYALEERMGGRINTSGKMQSEMDKKLLRICRRMKQENIDVYAVVFDVTAGSNIDKKMKSCASAPAAPYYFNATDGDELKDAFEEIAENLTSLHVSQ